MSAGEARFKVSEHAPGRAMVLGFEERDEEDGGDHEEVVEEVFHI